MRRAAWVLVVLAGLAAPAGVVYATHALADTLGRNFGALAAASVGVLHPTPEPASDAAPPVVAAPEPVPVPAEVLTAPPAKGSRRAPSKVKAQPAPTLGVRISARHVLELARRQAIPQAIPLAAEGGRPTGLRLVGVAGLGVGMKDGDVLTRVAGVPATSVAAVADVVIRARARHAPEISAEFWRGNSRGMLVVEQPYIGANSAAVPPSTSPAEASSGAGAP